MTCGAVSYIESGHYFRPLGPGGRGHDEPMLMVIRLWYQYGPDFSS
jgi:hypothetical protein